MTTLTIITRFCIQLFSMIFNYLKLLFFRFKWVLEFLLYHPFYSLRVRDHPPQGFQILKEEEEEEEEEEVEIWNPREGEEVDCALCLSKIGEGEEVRVLRCEHVFHRECLYQWVGLRNYTCPLCRDFLGCGMRAFNGEAGEAHLLFFKFSSFTRNSEAENWWLR